MSNKQLTGIFGLSAPILFGIASYVFLTIYNPNLFNINDDSMIVGFIVKDMNGYEFVKYFNHLLIGLIIIGFSFGLIKNTSNDGASKIGKILLLISGLIYMSFAFTDINDDSDFTIFLLFSRLILVLVLGAFSFLLIANELLEISNSKLVKWTIFSFGVFIFINGILQLIAQGTYPLFMKNVSWIIYFLGIGIIGANLLREPAHNIG